MGTTDTPITYANSVSKIQSQSSNKASHSGIHFLLLHHLVITAWHSWSESYASIDA